MLGAFPPKDFGRRQSWENDRSVKAGWGSPRNRGWGCDAQVGGQNSRTAIWSTGRSRNPPVPARTVHKSRDRVRSTRGDGIDQFGQRSHNVFH